MYAKFRINISAPYEFITPRLVPRLIILSCQGFQPRYPRQRAFISLFICHSYRFLLSLRCPFTSGSAPASVFTAARWRGLFYSAASASVSSPSASGSGAAIFSGNRSTSVMLSGMLRHALPVVSSRYWARI